MNLKLLVFLAAVLLFACAPYPMVDYYDLDDAIATAETPEEAEYYKGKLESWESRANKAAIWLEMWKGCTADSNCNQVCEYHGASPTFGSQPDKNRVHKGVPNLVRWYEYTKPPNCGFMTPGDRR